jgi:Mrp family chromosome partitioning ATPase
LLGQVSLDDVLVQIAPNAFLIPRGSSTPYPYELLGGEKMKQLAQLLKERFSYVIYDSAPVGVVSDALALAPIADGTVVICRQKVSYQGDVKKVIKKLKFFQANVLGVVVSGCDFKLSQHALYAKK